MREGADPRIRFAPLDVVMAELLAGQCLHHRRLRGAGELNAPRRVIPKHVIRSKLLSIRSVRSDGIEHGMPVREVTGTLLSSGSALRPSSGATLATAFHNQQGDSASGP